MELQASKTKIYIQKALKDSALRDAVDKATQTALQRRAEKVEQNPYWEELRHLGHAAKRQILEHLDQYLQTFEEECRKNGMIVHWARDGDSGDLA